MPTLGFRLRRALRGVRTAPGPSRAEYLGALAVAWAGVCLAETVDQRWEAFRRVRTWTAMAGDLTLGEQLAAWWLGQKVARR